VQAVADADIADLLAVKGIGQKTAQRIFDLCRRPYR
jgi:Holliday junction resolvasome RuvABC DNA-binding subunit